MALTDAVDRQKRKPGNDRDTMRAKADRVLTAGVPTDYQKWILNKGKKVEGLSFEEHSEFSQQFQAEEAERTKPLDIRDYLNLRPK